MLLQQVVGQALQKKKGKRTASHNQIWSQEQTLTAVDQETFEGQDDIIGWIDCSTIAGCSSSSCNPDLVRAPKTPSGHGTMRVAVWARETIPLTV